MSKPTTYEDIVAFMHCPDCLRELPKDVAPAEYASFEVGLASNRKLALYCKRHEKIVGEFTLKNPPEVKCSCPGCTNPMEFDEPATKEEK